MILETKRLILREWNENDVGDLIEGLNNIEVSKWLAFVPYPYKKADAEKWIVFCIENAKIGYKIEGVKRKAFRCMADGEIKDEYITGLLIDEWITK